MKLKFCRKGSKLTVPLGEPSCLCQALTPLPGHQPSVRIRNVVDARLF
jgi:hypothetical protein